jgi:hypothetical protein
MVEITTPILLWGQFLLELNSILGFREKCLRDRVFDNRLGMRIYSTNSVK